LHLHQSSVRLFLTEQVDYLYALMMPESPEANAGGLTQIRDLG
jgi:hypothetical protein